MVGDSLDWILPNDEVDVLFVDEQAVRHPVPSAVEMAVKQTDPGVRGDTASGGGNKPATLESGVTVQVPLFVNEGDRVRSTRAPREYVVARLMRYDRTLMRRPISAGRQCSSAISAT